MNIMLSNIANDIERLVHTLSIMTPVEPKALEEYRQSLHDFRKEVTAGLSDTFKGILLVRSVKDVISSCSERLDDGSISTIERINTSLETLTKMLHEIDYHQMESKKTQSIVSAPSEEAIKFASELSLLKESTLTLTKEFESKILDYENKVSELKKTSEDLENKLSEKLELAKKIYQEAIDDTTSKKNNLQELMALTGETVLKGRYLEKSENEKSTANFLRWASSIFLVAASLFMIYALYKSASDLLSYAAILQKISIAIFLTLPAAYFARESSKHRELQNLYSQKALALATIDHYTNSLPAEEIYKIKCQLAPTLFNPSTQTAQDPFPLNSQELLIALIQKLDLKKDSKP